MYLITVFSSSLTGLPPYPIPTPGLHQSCRHVVRSWANQSFGAHLHNMTLSNGKLRVPQDGRYYLYSQVITVSIKLSFWLLIITAHLDDKDEEPSRKQHKCFARAKHLIILPSLAPSYLQVYFRYPSPAASDGDQRSVSHQLVQCVYKKTSYPSPIQVHIHLLPRTIQSCCIIQAIKYLPYLHSHLCFVL